MADINGPNFTMIVVFGTLSLSFLTYHTYKFDRCRCLVPTKKEWFRWLLTWMLFISNACLVGWAMGWCYVKYSLGWVRLGPSARSWPSALFPPPFNKFNTPLTILLGVCYSLQASLNAEEALYWYHLMRSVRSPQAARPFLRSSLFQIWILISIIVTAVQLAVPWIGHSGDWGIQLSKELLLGGIVEAVVLVAATTVLLKFPRFLLDVAAAGAGPEVRARLHSYHEYNKIRTFFRIIFTIPLFVAGGDGLTPGTPLNMNPLFADVISTIMVGSLCVVMMISITVYLPISPNLARVRVMVGPNPIPRSPLMQTTSGFALITLLREAGQWDGPDEDVSPCSPRIRSGAPFANAKARGFSWNSDAEERGGVRGSGQVNRVVPRQLVDFSSPIAVSSEAQPQRPVEIRIHVERDVTSD